MKTPPPKELNRRKTKSQGISGGCREYLNIKVMADQRVLATNHV